MSRLSDLWFVENKENLSALCGAAELGPFVIKGTVTEFYEARAA